jgi:DNA transformation protein
MVETPMPLSDREKEFASYVVDLMQLIGPVYAKSMFGGHGIFLEKLMFALIADSTLYLKADKVNEQEFKSKGLEQFSYMKQGKEYKMSYFQAPEESLEDGEIMREWANSAYSAALRAAAKKHSGKST